MLVENYRIGYTDPSLSIGPIKRCAIKEWVTDLELN